VSATPAEILESRVLLSATHLVFQVEPSDGIAGQTFSVSVAIDDKSGNVVTQNHSVVRLRVDGPGGYAGGGRTISTSAVNGIAMFNNLALDKAGRYTLRATDAALGRAVSGIFTISPDTTNAEDLAFLGSDPRSGTAGQPLRPIKVAVEDEFGNIVTTDDSSVTLSVNTGPTHSFDSSVQSPYTVNVQNGIAKFEDAILDTIGKYTLSATDSDNSISDAVSHPINIHG